TQRSVRCFDEPAKALAERANALPRCPDRVQSRQSWASAEAPAATPAAHGNPGFGELNMRKVAGSPLRSASACFPPASPVLLSQPGKQESIPDGHNKQRICLRKFGAGEGIRTLDPNLGKVVLYP